MMFIRLCSPAGGGQTYLKLPGVPRQEGRCIPCIFPQTTSAKSAYFHPSLAEISSQGSHVGYAARPSMISSQVPHEEGRRLSPQPSTPERRSKQCLAIPTHQTNPMTYLPT